MTFPRRETDNEPVGLAGLAFEMEFDIKLDERSLPHTSILCCRTPSLALSYTSSDASDASDSGSERRAEHEDEADSCTKHVRHSAMEDVVHACSPGSPKTVCLSVPRRTGSAAEYDAEFMHAATAVSSAGCGAQWQPSYLALGCGRRVSDAERRGCSVLPYPDAYTF